MAVSFLKSLRIPKIKHFQTIWPHFYEGLSHLQHNSCQISVPLPFRVSQRCPTLASIHFCALSSCTFHFLSPFFLLSTSCLICTWCISTLGSSVVPTPMLYVSQLSYTCLSYIYLTLLSNMPMCSLQVHLSWWVWPSVVNSVNSHIWLNSSTSLT